MPFQPLIAFGDGDSTVQNGQAFVCMGGVIPGGDRKCTAGYGDGAVGMDGVIGAVDAEGAAVDLQRSRRLDALEAGAVGVVGYDASAAAPSAPAAKAAPGWGTILVGVGTAAACGDLKGAAVDLQEG